MTVFKEQANKFLALNPPVDKPPRNYGTGTRGRMVLAVYRSASNHPTKGCWQARDNGHDE